MAGRIVLRFDNPAMPALLWDVYCRVVDNLGDAGVCWRLAADLAGRGHRVRLVIDDAAPLAFMAPQGAPGVEVHAWPGPVQPGAAVGDVVVEAFGCDPPPAAVAAMVQRPAPPVWINLEYLSAETWVERSHALPSPQRNGLLKWFYFPGYTAATGGLLREPALMQARAAHDRLQWLRSLGIAPRPQERVVVLFCYHQPALPALLHDLAAAPTLLLLTPGHAASQAGATPAGVRAQVLPWLPQVDFDRLLWSADLNFVRGEDSLVRALWAGAPFVWQAYPQDDGVHADKVAALAVRLALPPAVAALWDAWNAPAGAPWPGLPAHWCDAALAARAELLRQPDLVTQLLDFVGTRLPVAPGC